MGVPKLLTILTPYGERRVLGEQIVIDGPSLAYHVANLCQANSQPTEELGHTFDQSTNQQLGQAALAWLDELSSRGNSISALFFDAYLPQSKLPTRLKRTHSTSMRWKDVFISYQRQIPGYETGIRRPNGRLPPPAFAVPAVLDALHRSPVYAPLTKLVPGEADVFCAQYVQAQGGGTVITSDSDLLVHDLGPNGNVVFLRDIDLQRTEVGGGSQPLVVPVFSSTTVRSKLALQAEDDMQAFAFELSMDPHLSMNGLIERAKQKVAVSAYPQDYAQFVEQYALPASQPMSAGPYDINGLDPRVSEFVLQCLLPSPKDQDVLVFIPQLLESWARGNAWESSAPLRQCAFGLIQIMAGRRIEVIREYTRMPTASSQGNRLELPAVPQVNEALSRLTTLLRRIQKQIREPRLWWVVLSLCQDIELARAQEKESVCLTVLHKETPADGILQRPSWDTAHWVSQITGTLYSLRILQQLLEFVGCQADASQWKEPPSELQELRQMLSLVTPLEEYPSLLGVRNLPARLRDAGALALVAELAELPQPIGFLAGSREKEFNKKKRKRAVQTAAAAVAATATDGNPRQSKNPFLALDAA